MKLSKTVASTVIVFFGARWLSLTDPSSDSAPLATRSVRDRGNSPTIVVNSKGMLNLDRMATV